MSKDGKQKGEFKALGIIPVHRWCKDMAFVWCILISIVIIYILMRIRLYTYEYIHNIGDMKNENNRTD